MKFYIFRFSKFKCKCGTFSELSRGSIGEKYAVGETMLGYLKEIGCCVPFAYVTAHQNFVHLPSCHVDKFKYGITDALGYNKCRFGSTLEAALMEKSINGEKIA
jgi:hypothetical protein